MKSFLFVLILLGLWACASVQSPAQQPGQRRPRIVYAEKFPGTDIGMKINAADAALGAEAGEIRVSAGGNIATQINISPHHTLRITGGSYTATTNSSVIRLKDNSSLLCDNWDAVLRESTGKAGASSPFTVVRDYNGDVSNYAPSENINIRGCHFKGARSDFNSVPQTVSLGNCRNCQVTNNWLDATRTIGIQAGGGSSEKNYASNVLIARNLLTEVASQNIAVTNGDSVIVEANIIRQPGQVGGPGVSVIDIEPNSGDRLRNIRVVNNRIDATRSTNFAVLHGVAVQNYDTTSYGPVEVVGNTIIGATHETPRYDYITYAGIVLNNAPNVTVRNNYIQRVPWGIKVNPRANKFVIAGNELSSCGSGSTYAISIVDASDGLVVNNYLHEGVGDLVSVGVTALQVVENTLGGPLRGNIYHNNRGAVYQLIGPKENPAAQTLRRIAALGTPFAELGAPADRQMVYCSDCRATATCTGGGSGSWAKKQGGRWKCN